MTLEQTITDFQAYLERIKMYESAMSTMYFDSSTIAPKGGVKARAKRFGFFEMEIFNLKTSETMKSYLDVLDTNIERLDLKVKAMYRKAKQDYEKLTKTPPNLIKRTAELKNEAIQVWTEAKEENDFQKFAPYLKELIDLQKEVLTYRTSPGQNPYDVLLNDYEEGMTIEIYDAFFNQLKETIVPLLKRIVKSPYQVESDFLYQSVPIENQRKISTFISEKIGYNLNCGHIGESAHPFCNGSHKTDVRITTRYEVNDFMSSFYSILHECGHAIYEQNISDDISETNIGSGCSMGIHESQSRFYENIIGRSQGFWDYILPELKAYLPETFQDVTAEAFFKGVNQSKPSLIRVEADELTYSLHILIRYEIEKMLFTEDVAIDDLPRIWKEKYEAYLGITPPTDTLGILQDIHWSMGAYGYFPTYALGSAYASQLFAYMEKDLDVNTLISQGAFHQITKWLGDNIHKHGAIYSPLELIKNIAGETLNANYYTNYLTEKFGKLYQL